MAETLRTDEDMAFLEELDALIAEAEFFGLLEFSEEVENEDSAED